VHPATVAGGPRRVNELTVSVRSAMLGGVIGLGVQTWGTAVLAGEPEAVAARIGAYAAAGARDLMLGFTDFPSTRMPEDFALRVRPRLEGLARSVVAS